MMLRRGFLQMLGLGSVASAIGQEAAVMQKYNSMTSASPAIGFGMASLSDQIANAKREYETFTNAGKEAFIARTLRDWKEDGIDFNYRGIDPDIKAMKSWSRSTKVRVHFERKAELRWKSSERYMIIRISSLLGMEKKDDLKR